MAYPVAYRGGRAAAAALPRAPAGFQLPGLGRPSPGWFRGGLGILGRFSAAGAIAVTAVELYRWYMGGMNLPALGYYMSLNCKTAPITRWTTGVEACLERSLGSYNALPVVVQATASYDLVTMLWQRPVSGITRNDVVQAWRRPASARVAGTVGMRPPLWMPYVYAPPRVHPMAIPLGQPVIRPVPPVAAGVPKTPALPEDSAGGQPGWAAPTARPRTASHVFTPSGYKPTTVPTVRAVPSLGTKEQKLRMSPGLGALVFGFNAATELSDLVDALYDALPKDSPCREGVKGTVSQVFKADAVNRCFSNIDWTQAMFNIAWQNLEDEIWAKLGLPTKEAGMSYGMNAPANIALSKALGKQVKDATAYVEAYMGTAFKQATGWSDAQLQSRLDSLHKSRAPS